TGFFNMKTKAVRGSCAKIVEDYGGEVPRTMAELITLPGVARKTANIVQGNSYPEEHARDPDAGIAVDTHVRRVSQRLGFTTQSTAHPLCGILRHRRAPLPIAAPFRLAVEAAPSFLGPPERRIILTPLSWTQWV